MIWDPIMIWIPIMIWDPILIWDTFYSSDNTTNSTRKLFNSDICIVQGSYMYQHYCLPDKLSSVQIIWASYSININELLLNNSFYDCQISKLIYLWLLVNVCT